MPRKSADADPKPFNAQAYAAQFDANVTVKDVLDLLPPKTRRALDEAEVKLVGDTPTFHSGQIEPFDANRRQLHDRILNEVLSDQAIDRSTPSVGSIPTFIMLGGRGGSGKSWFKVNAYDPNKFLIIDADDIKVLLPEYEGWNAAQVHEESGAIVERILELACVLRLNVVIDKTMKSLASAQRDIDKFQSGKYKIEIYYMFLPRLEAAKRAALRFTSSSGRFVPVSVILSNTENEHNFDVVRRQADRWLFYDNRQKGRPPLLIAEG